MKVCSFKTTLINFLRIASKNALALSHFADASNPVLIEEEQIPDYSIYNYHWTNKTISSELDDPTVFNTNPPKNKQCLLAFACFKNFPLLAFPGEKSSKSNR
jgi:hypothetical protein